METSETTRAPATPLSRDLLNVARYHLGGRRALIALAALIAVAGTVLNWSWLVAVGVAPLLLGVLPCVVMCALGLCMSRMAGRSCSAGRDSARSATPAKSSPSQVLPAAARVEPLAPSLHAPMTRAEAAADDIPTADIVQPQTSDERT